MPGNESSGGKGTADDLENRRIGAWNYNPKPGVDPFIEMKSAFRFILLALVLLIVAMVSALTAMRFAIHGQEVAVPALVGLTPQQAEHAVAGTGLQMTIERQY